MCTCDQGIDNGAGLSWAFLLAGEEQSFINALRIAPFGLTPVTLGLAADAPSIAPGGADGYTFTISNPGQSREPLELGVADPAAAASPLSPARRAGRSTERR